MKLIKQLVMNFETVLRTLCQTDDDLFDLLNSGLMLGLLLEHELHVSFHVFVSHLYQLLRSMKNINSPRAGAIKCPAVNIRPFGIPQTHPGNASGQASLRPDRV